MVLSSLGYIFFQTGLHQVKRVFCLSLVILSDIDKCLRSYYKSKALSHVEFSHSIYLCPNRLGMEHLIAGTSVTQWSLTYVLRSATLNKVGWINIVTSLIESIRTGASIPICFSRSEHFKPLIIVIDDFFFCWCCSFVYSKHCLFLSPGFFTLVCANAYSSRIDWFL